MLEELVATTGALPTVEVVVGTFTETGVTQAVGFAPTNASVTAGQQTAQQFGDGGGKAVNWELTRADIVGGGIASSSTEWHWSIS